MSQDCENCKYEEIDGDNEPCVSCEWKDYRSNYKPKEEEKVEKSCKTYSTGQMIDAWLNNNKLRFILNGDKNEEVKLINDGLKWNKEQCLVISNDLKNFTWTIIEPEAIKVSFAEAFKAYRDGKNVMSYSGSIYGDNYKDIDMATDEEINEDWEVLE